MRSNSHRASLVIASAVIGLVLALLANGAAALDTPDEDPVSDERVETYASTPVHDDHDPRNAAHPLRIVAYGLHPVGVALDWIVVRPAVWVVRHEPFRTIFGYED
jgi:hypothetical protein